MTKQLHITDPQDALYAACRKFPGGIAALADKRDLTPEALYQKLDRSNHRGRITFGDELDSFLDQLRAAGVDLWDAPLVALAFRHGGMFTRLPAVAAGSDVQVECAAQLVALVREFGEFSSELARDAEADGISEAEAERIRKEGMDVVQAVNRLIAWADQQAAQRRAKHLRAVA